MSAAKLAIYKFGRYMTRCGKAAKVLDQRPGPNGKGVQWVGKILDISDRVIWREDGSHEGTSKLDLVSPLQWDHPLAKKLDA